jgi:hypothetical protein
MTNEANMVLSGSSPMKMIGNTAAMIARFREAFHVDSQDLVRSDLIIVDANP